MSLVYDVFWITGRAMDHAVVLSDEYLARLDGPCYAVCVNGEPLRIDWHELSAMADEAREIIAHYTQVGERRLQAAHLSLDEYCARRQSRASLVSIGRMRESRWNRIVASLDAVTHRRRDDELPMP